MSHRIRSILQLHFIPEKPGERTELKKRVRGLVRTSTRVSSSEKWPLLDELVFVVVLLGIAEGGTDAAGDLDGEPVAVPVVALPVVPVDLAGALAVGHAPPLR